MTSIALAAMKVMRMKGKPINGLARRDVRPRPEAALHPRSGRNPENLIPL